MKKLFFFFLLFLQPYIFGQQYYFKRYTSMEGLSQNTIRALKQDNLGRLWIGTADGLSVYDGNEFDNYSEAEGLSGTVVDCFFQQAPDTMWVSLVLGGISVLYKPKLHSDKVIRIIKGKKYFADNTINKIFRDSGGRLWFCTDDGISSWSNANPDNCIIRHYNGKNDPGHIYTYCVTEDRGGTLWFGTEKGLYKFSDDKFSFIRGSPIVIGSILRVNSDSLWLGTNTGILIYNGTTFSKPFRNSPLSKSEINQIYRDKQANIYIASTDGLFIFDGTKLKNFSNYEGSKNKFVLTSLKDSFNDLWIGTVDGLYKLLNRNFYYINAHFKYNYLYDLMPRKNGTVYTTTDDGIFKIKNNRLFYSSINKKLPTKKVSDYLVDKNTKWIGTALGLVKIKNGSVKIFTKKDGFDSNYITHILKGGKDSIWVGTRNYGESGKGKVYLIYHDRVICPAVLDSLKSNPVTALFIDRNKALWIGYFSTGLYRLFRGRLSRITSPGIMPALDIRAIKKDRDGNIWIMTRFSGIYKYSDGKFENFSEKDGLTSNWVMGMVQDKSGTLWFSTASGICRFDGKRFYRLTYGGNLMSGEMWGEALDYKGRLWFANENYIFVYKPGEETTKHSGDIYIKDFIANDKEVKNIPDVSPLIDYNNNSVEFSFHNVNYGDPESVSFQYYLKGFNISWSHPTKRNYVVYNHLPPGKYSFCVRAQFNDGSRGRINSDVSFIISTPLQQKTWFIILIFLAGAGIVSLITALIYQYRIRQIVRIQKIRSRIASDLHDDIGASLSSISIFSELANMKISRDPEDASQLVNRIGKMAREVTESMGDIVWVINPGKDSLNEVMEKMKDFSFELLTANDIELKFNIAKDIPRLKLSMDTRRNLLLIFKESINNISKHSGAAVVSVSMELKRENGVRKILELTIKDNGKGFETGIESKGNGLKNLKKRASEINAVIDISSEPGRGTITRLQLPVE